MKLRIYSGDEVRDLRKKLCLNQKEFWAYFQTTQSGGSRYEAGREIPAPVQVLLNIAFASDARAETIVNELRTLGRSNKKHRAGESESV